MSAFASDFTAVAEAVPASLKRSCENNTHSPFLNLSKCKGCKNENLQIFH